MMNYPNYNLKLTNTGVIHEVKFLTMNESDQTLCGQDTKDLRIRTGPRQDDDNFAITKDAVNCVVCATARMNP